MIANKRPHVLQNQLHMAALASAKQDTMPTRTCYQDPIPYCQRF